VQQHYGHPHAPGPHAPGPHPPQAPPHYGHAPGYGPPGHGPQGYGPDPRVTDLESQSTTWLIVGAVGFFLGVGFVTGPLAWFQGARLRNQYRQLGLPPGSNATGAWIIGIVSTALFALAAIGIALMLLLFAGAIASAGM
jgi:hypothetical protein